MICRFLGKSLWGWRIIPNFAPQKDEMIPTETIRLRILHTSDVHGYVRGPLCRLAKYVEQCRSEMPDGVVLTDGGDVLQGTPTTYFYNIVRTDAEHLVAATMNRVGYDVATIGNHDIEQGHGVYDRWVSQCRFPVLGANVVREDTGEPYFAPYTVLHRRGLRIAVLGLLTPAIPYWVPRKQWSGLRFEDMVEAARKWIPLIRQREEPDMIIGLFHSGIEEQAGVRTEEYCENEVRQVVREVGGLDLVLYGHDHRRHIERLSDAYGNEILCIGPSSTGAWLCEVEVEVQRREGRVVSLQTRGQLLPVGQLLDLEEAEEAESEWFPEAFEAVETYKQTVVGMLDSEVREREAFFGPSAFINLLHDLQFALCPEAQISFAAPLSFDAVIAAGPIRVADMYGLYKYENLLYTLRLSGREVLGFLEMSYDLWVNTMHSPDDHLLLLDYVFDNGRRLGLKNLAYNFEAAAGICYTVDASKPDGQKVTILTMEDGTPFDLDAEYLVVTNSYRGNGGGELLTRGAGIRLEELRRRLVASSEQDMRSLFIEHIRKQGHINPNRRDNWRFLPEEWARAALARDRRILFPK